MSVLCSRPRRLPVAVVVVAAVAGLLLVASATAQGRREIGEAVRTVGEVDWQEGGGPFEPLEAMDSVFLHWTLVTGHRSALAMKYYPRSVLLMGSGTRVEVVEIEGLPPDTECSRFKVKEGHVHLSVDPGIDRADCPFEVATRDLTLETTATDFALVVNRLYGTWVTVIEGRVRIELTRIPDSFDLTAGETALVRGKRVWRGQAVELGSAPPGVPLLPPPS